MDNIKNDLAYFAEEAPEEVSKIEKSSYALQNLINFEKAQDKSASKERPQSSQNPKVPAKPKSIYRPCTQHHQAKCVIEEDRISHVPKTTAFVVKSTDGKRKHLVELFPK